MPWHGWDKQMLEKTDKGRHETKGNIFIMRRTWFFPTTGSKITPGNEGSAETAETEKFRGYWGKDKSVAGAPVMYWRFLKRRCDYFTLQNGSLRHLKRKICSKNQIAIRPKNPPIL